MKRKEAKKTFEVEIAADHPVYIISVVSEIVRIPIWTLRKLDQLGVVKPVRIGKTRCYSKDQMKQLNYIYYLLEEKKVNISAIKVVLEINKEFS